MRPTRHDTNFPVSGGNVVLRHGYGKRDRKKHYAMVVPSIDGEVLRVCVIRRKDFRDFHRGRLKPLVGGLFESRLSSIHRMFRVSGMELSREAATALRDALDKVLSTDT